MTINIPISEAISLIKEKTGRDITLEVIDSHSISMGYEITVNIPLLGKKSKKVNMDVAVDKVVGKDIYLRYSTSVIGGDTIVAGLLAVTPAFNIPQVLESCPNSTIIVHLNEVPQAQEALNKIDIHSISFDENSIVIDFSILLN